MTVSYKRGLPGQAAPSASEARSARWIPLGVSTPTNCAPSLDPDDALVAAQQHRQRLLEGGADVDGRAEVAGADAVERLEVGRGRSGSR